MKRLRRYSARFLVQFFKEVLAVTKPEMIFGICAWLGGIAYQSIQNGLSIDVRDVASAGAFATLWAVCACGCWLACRAARVLHRKEIREYEECTPVLHYVGAPPPRKKPPGWKGLLPAAVLIGIFVSVIIFSGRYVHKKTVSPPQSLESFLREAIKGIRDELKTLEGASAKPAVRPKSGQGATSPPLRRDTKAAPSKADVASPDSPPIGNPVDRPGEKTTTAVVGRAEISQPSESLNGVVMNQTPVSSDRTDAPYALDLSLRTLQETSPVRIVIQCDHEIIKAIHSFDNADFRGYYFGPLPGSSQAYVISYASPALKANTPIPIRLWSKQPLRCKAGQ